MQALSDSVALAVPNPEEHSYLEGALRQISRRQRKVEVRIGVGPMATTPLRLLGHAACVAETMRVDLRALCGRVDQVCIFSSAPKTRMAEVSPVIAIGALAGALKMAGVECPILLDLACSYQEVPPVLHCRFPETLTEWLERASRRNRNQTDGHWYAIEHAAPSMFGDLVDDSPLPVPFRVTIGAAPEARFWAARQRVRLAARAHRYPVAPALGLIMRSLQVPWYSVTGAEPPLSWATQSGRAALDALEDAANPRKAEGNAGLKREARATKRLIEHSGLPALIEAVTDENRMQAYIGRNGFMLSARLEDALRTRPGATGREN